MLKKIAAVFLAVISCMTISAFGYEIETTSTSLYVQTYECPTDIMSYATDNVTGFAMAMDEDDILSPENIYLGQPFTYGVDLSHLYTFPVFYGNEVIYTLRVAYAPDSSIHGTMSTFLVDELNSYLGQTSLDTPLTFSVANHALYAAVGETQELVCEFPINEVVESVSLANAQNNEQLTTINIAIPADIGQSVNSVEPVSCYLALSGREVQPNGNNWCTAYSMAAILTTQTGATYTARQIMEYYYGSGVTDDDSLALNEVAYYAREIAALSSTSYTTNKLSNNQLIAQIDDGNPVYLGMDNLTSGGGHAIVLRGYDRYEEKWSIWNPSKKTEVMKLFRLMEIISR